MAAGSPPDQLNVPSDDANVENGRANSKDSNDAPKPNLAFNNASVRAAFVRKVFAIVTLMVLINALMTAPVVLFKEPRLFIKEHNYLYIVALIVFLATYFTLVCCSSVARNFPCNFILLTAFTFAAGFILMVICASVPPYTVALALITTALTCIAIILFASQTTFDITKYVFIIFVVSIGVCIFGIALAIMSLFVYVKLLHVVFSAVACVLFMAYLAVDIQMILGGRKYEISPEDYIYAALMLFVDIYEIFINILNLYNANN
ncbi:N-methyl-D-aspartate receptor associated protein [Trichostrongylus colubriformis]|uniref:N-methyl-D-aspartate receptor associated protein n=1 Tax=Trichostrongylus colubriformis TaxID=6319 RepID=A0AAN8G1Y3_TRICO